jgi:chromosome segregation ATPase
LQEQNIQSIAEIAELREKNTQLQSSAKPLAESIAKKSNEYMSKNNIIDKTKYLIYSIFGNFTKPSDRNIENLDILKEFKKESNNSFEDVINKHNEILKRIHAEYEKIIYQHKTKNEELKQNENALMAKQLELEKNIATVNQQLEKCKSEPNKLDESKDIEIAKLQSEKAELETKISVIENKITESINNTIPLLETKIAEAKQLDDSKDKEILQLQKDKLELEKSIELVNEQLRKSMVINKQLDNKQTEKILELETKILELNDKNKVLQLELDNLNRQKEENDKNNKDLVALELELMTLKIENARLSEENNLYKTKIDELLANLEIVNLKNKSLIEEKAILTNNLSKLNYDIQTQVNNLVQEKKTEYENELKKLSDKVGQWSLVDALTKRDLALKRLENSEKSLEDLNSGSKITKNYLTNEIEQKAIEISRIAIELETLKIAKVAYIKELQEIKEKTISKKEHEIILNKLTLVHKEEIDTLKKEIDSLNTKITDLTKEYQKNIVSSNNNLTEEYKDKIANLEKEKQNIIDSLTSELESYKQLNNKNIDYVKNIIKELLLENLDNSKLSNNNLTSINILNEKIKSLIDLYDNKDLIQNSDEIKTQVINNINEYKKQIVAILYKNSELENTISDLTIKNNKLRTEKQLIENELTKYRDSNDQNSAEISKLQKELSDITTKYNANISTLGIIKEELVKLKESTKILTFEKLELEKMNKLILEENVRKLEEITKENKTKSDELNNQISELNRLIESNKNNYDISIEQKLKENERLSEELKKLQQTSSELQTKNETLQQKLNAEIETLNRDIVAFTELKTKLESEIQRLEEYKQMKDENNIELNKTIGTKIAENESLISRITDLNKKNKLQLSNITELTTKNEQCIKQLNKCRVELSSTSQSLQSCNNEKELLQSNVITLRENISKKDVEIIELKKLNEQLKDDLKTAKKNVISGDDFYYFVDKPDNNKQNNIIKSKPKNTVIDKFTIYMQNAIKI